MQSFSKAVASFPDDCNLVVVLALQTRNQRNLNYHHEGSTELLLSPRCLSSLMGNPPCGTPSTTTTHTYLPNYMVITIMEPPSPSSPQERHPQSHPPGVATIQGRDYSSSSLYTMASIPQR
ncbi:unnamed protein product [Coregonus sp. 'balchen']|nr:unnamed protein product [Coregonus sp. 'balchen']